MLGCQLLKNTVRHSWQCRVSITVKLCGATQQKRCFVNITPEIEREFQENGVVCLRGVFDKSWLKICEKGIGKNLISPSIYCDWLTDDGDKRTGLFFNDYYNYNKIPEYNDYIRESPAAGIAKQIINSKKIGLFHEHVFFKDRGSMKETPWHHDQAYYPLNGTKNCSIWMPTTAVSKNTSLKFIKGSHLWNKWFIPRLFESNENYMNTKDVSLSNYKNDNIDDIQTVIDRLHEHTILQWELEPGDCIVFHMKTIHGTKASVSTNKRIVMSTRWLGDDMTYCKRPWKTSPPKDLLPKSLNYGDIMVENEEFMSQVFTIN